MFHPTIKSFQFYKRLCTSVLEMLVSLVGQLFSVHVEVPQSSLDLKDTKNSHRGLETKSSPATHIFNMVNMPTVPMSRWIVWITDWEGEYVKAHKVIEGSKTVSFIVEDGIISTAVKTYKLKDIKDYHIIE
jgi:hypothetical protein